MVEDTALLQLIWLASPALPVGGFSYSEGLEAAIDAGCVADEAGARAWLCDQLHLSLARSDLAVLQHAVDAFRAGDAAQVQELDAWILRTRETAEMKLQAVQMGRSLIDWMRSLGDATPARRDTLTYPLAYAMAASRGSATPRQVALAYAFGWAENMVQAAVKAVPLGQGAGQRILAALAREIPEAVDHAAALHPDQRQCFAPMLAILSARHEAQYSRLFRS